MDQLSQGKSMLLGFLSVHLSFFMLLSPNDNELELTHQSLESSYFIFQSRLRTI